MNYREEVLRTAQLEKTSLNDQLLMGALGLTGEAGEVADLIKKCVYHGKDLNVEDLVKELGDVRWYLEYLVISIDKTMQEIETKNTEKLRKRYPEGFSQEAANERKDEV